MVRSKIMKDSVWKEAVGMHTKGNLSTCPGLVIMRVLCNDHCMKWPFSNLIWCFVIITVHSACISLSLAPVWHDAVTSWTMPSHTGIIRHYLVLTLHITVASLVAMCVVKINCCEGKYRKLFLSTTSQQQGGKK